MFWGVFVGLASDHVVEMAYVHLYIYEICVGGCVFAFHMNTNIYIKNLSHSHFRRLSRGALASFPLPTAFTA